MTLKLRQVETFYGNSQALFGVDMTVRGTTTLLGRNGMGKTTTVNSILGLADCRRGEIWYDEVKISGLAPHEIAHQGIGLVPEGRQIFPNLTARENLIATAANHNHAPAPWTLERVLELFPPLAARLNHMGDQLSGGEQQMLAVGRALMLNPALLILDEATEGLAPLVQRDLWDKLYEIKQTGISLLLIDKNLEELSTIADYHYIIEKGAIVWHGDSHALRITDGLKARYLSI